MHVTASTGGKNEKVYVRLCDSSGKALTAYRSHHFSTDDPYNWGFQSGESYMGLCAGTYYLWVSKSGSHTPTTYRIKTDYYTSASDKLRIASHPQNCYLNCAKVFSIGDQLQGVALSQKVYYQFSLPEGYALKITSEMLDVKYSSGADYTIYNDTGKMVNRDKDGKYISGSSFIEYKKTKDDIWKLSPGIYYIGITQRYVSGVYKIDTNLIASQYSAKDNNPTIITGPAISKVKSSKGKISVYFDKPLNETEFNNIDYIEFQCSRNKKFVSGVKRRSVEKTVSKIVIKLTKNKTYYLRARYVLNNGTSKWSKVKKIRMR